MGQERWERIDEIFHSALEVAAEGRAAFLEDTCSGSTEIRREVERLLRHYDEADSFLEQPAIEVAAGDHTPVLRESMEGEIVSHYRVGAKLGSGGMGVVYRAEDLRLRRGVALKFLYERKHQEQAIVRLLAEARAASGLNHLNICTVYAIEEHHGQPMLVMELLEGEDLRERMKTGPVELAELIRIGTQACDALAAAHAKGIVHRDIKPANIFLTNEGRLKLLDFGLAKWMQASEPEEYGSDVAGTLLYMSPEQLRGEEIDGRSDLFSLGVVLYELATGVRSFERENALSTIEAILETDVPAPSTVNPALPAGFNRLIARMLDKDRERRPASAAAVSRELLLLDEHPVRTRGKWIAVAASVALFLCCVVALVVSRRSAPALGVKDTIVLGSFANETGNPAFDETLRPAFAAEFRQSPFLSLISEQRIHHVLGLMARPADTPLTGETAREICERTQSVAVLDGTITGNAPRYALLLRAQNCRTGEVIYREQAQAARKEDVFRAVGVLAGGFRKRAGESLTTIAQHSTPLFEATTPSFEAWRTFSEGMKLAMLQGHAVGIPYLKHAIEIDPHFATAFAMLGRDYSSLGEMEVAREYTRHAFQERRRASQQERFYIDYDYDRIVTGNLEKAMRTADLWTQAYPRDPLGHAFYGAVAHVLGRFDKAVEESKKTLDIDADQTYAYVHLASVAVYRSRYGEAQQWVARAVERKLTVPDFAMIRHLIAFLEGNTMEMERVDIPSEGMSEIQDWIWGERADVLAFSGHLRQARAMGMRAVQVAVDAKRSEAAAQHQASAAVREALFGNREEAVRNAEAVGRLSNGKDATYGAALAFALTGHTSRAQALTDDLARRYPEDTLVRFSLLPTLQSIAAIQRGKAGEGLRLLQPAVPYEFVWLGCCSVGFVGTLYPTYVRGEAHLALKEGPEAAAEFQKIIDYRGLAGSNPIGALAHWRKGKGLALAGRTSEARKEYEQFLTLWREADADIPILRTIKAEYGRLLPERQ